MPYLDKIQQPCLYPDMGTMAGAVWHASSTIVLMLVSRCSSVSPAQLSGAAAVIGSIHCCLLQMSLCSNISGWEDQTANTYKAVTTK
jgi:hypothetical protein